MQMQMNPGSTTEKGNERNVNRFLLLSEMPGPLNLGLAAVAFISPQNHPILVRAFSGSPEDLLKHHYLAHISLDVIDERGKPSPNACPSVQPRRELKYHLP